MVCQAALLRSRAGRTYHEAVSAPAPQPETDPGGFAAACAALDDDLGWALGAVARSYRGAAKDAIGELPGGPRGYQVLRFAAEESAATQLAIAQRLGIDRTVMTYLLDDLERAGLVERRPDPADRRARRVVATTEGRTRLALLDERLRLAEGHVLAPLSAAEAAQFRTLLQRLATQVDDFTPAVACQEAEALDAVDSAKPRRRRTHS
jgi:DNA-binding MarR family transcriptional regulator